MIKKYLRSFSLIEILVGMSILAVMSIGIYSFSTNSQKTVTKSANLINFMQSFARLLLYYEKDSMRAILPADLQKNLSSFQNTYDAKNFEVKNNGVKTKVEYIYDKKKGTLTRKGGNGKKTVLFDSGLSELKMNPFILYYTSTVPGYRPGVFVSATYKERDKVVKTLKRIIFFKYNKDVQDTYNSWKYQ
ncbi:prepilin-type N-terminal cleavage/methylation domain-containing protein [bacterium]|nr:prepilin-type N-terminal cleavage/methylation domain-containing protein [bacterium]